MKPDLKLNLHKN